MSELKLSGSIKVIGETKGGHSVSGKDWKKVTFVIANNDGYEGREQVFAFEIFGEEAVDKFLQYNQVGKNVEVSYNIKCNEHKGNYYTSLSAWKVFGSDAGNTTAKEMIEEESDIPF